MCTVLQALKKAFSDGNFSWQRPDISPAPAGVLRGMPSGGPTHGICVSMGCQMTDLCREYHNQYLRHDVSPKPLRKRAVYWQSTASAGSVVARRARQGTGVAGPRPSRRRPSTAPRWQRPLRQGPAVAFCFSACCGTTMSMACLAGV